MSSCPIHNQPLIATLNDGGSILYKCGCLDKRFNMLFPPIERQLYIQYKKNPFNNPSRMG